LTRSNNNDTIDYEKVTFILNKKHMKAKKRSIVLSMILAITISSATVDASSNCEERIFTTTAYYSPLPDQAFYIL
jgi:hypothetical protein